ncbi:MAG: cupredoxin domain-containing protein [Lentisphaerae bacterium]|nr:cupredoxin domain-containing protein [Lentisphaerota bacterium]
MKYFSSRIIIASTLWLAGLCLGRAEEKFIELKARKFSYTPSIIKVNKGDNVRIRLLSEDVHHGLYLDGYDIQTSALPGREGQLKFVADKPGRFSFRCSVTCGALHPYMIGYLYVEHNRNFYASMAAVILMGLLALLCAVRQRQGAGEFKLFGLIPLSWRLPLLTKFPWLRPVFKSRWMPLIGLIINLFIFTVILMAAVVGGISAGNYNFGVMIVWILWWVLLMLFMVPIVGRLWCMVCPFPLFGDWIQRGRLASVGRQKSWGLAKRWPNKWRNLWPLVILFWIATWFSAFFTVKPLATFLLLGIVILLAVIIGLIFEKRSFCLFVCPVSGFQGLYSNFSLFAVRARDPEVCKNHKQKTCFIGNEKGYGCPWMEMPFEMNRNTYCGLCLECFKTCPYDNMDFFLRPFGQDFLAPRRRTDDIYHRRGTDEAFKALTMIGIFLLFFTAFQGPSAALKDMVTAKTAGGYAAYVAESLLIDFALIPLALLSAAWLSRKLSGNKEVPLKQVFVNFSYCLVPVGLAVWGAFSFIRSFRLGLEPDRHRQLPLDPVSDRQHALSPDPDNSDWPGLCPRFRVQVRATDLSYAEPGQAWLGTDRHFPGPGACILSETVCRLEAFQP